MYKYSIIIPVYNAKVTIHRLLKSIPFNLNPEIEVIVVDDNSSEPFDTSPYASFDNIKFINNIHGKGAGGARNTGVECSSGLWVIFADSDDYFIEGAFLEIEHTINSIDKEVDLIFYPPISKYIHTEINAKRHLKYSSLVNNFIKDPSKNNEILLKFSHYVPWSKIIRRSLIVENSIYFDETIIANDGMFSAKTSRLSKSIIAFDTLIYCVTVSDTSLTNIKKEHNLRVRLEVFCNMYNYLDNETKKIIGFSPLGLLYISSKYGPKIFIKSLVFIIKNKVSLFENLNFKSLHRFIKK